jgi:hypothetical protein
MTLTKKKLDKMLEEIWELHVTKEQRDVILKRFGREPGGREVWSEEDICAQVINILAGRPPIS